MPHSQWLAWDILPWAKTENLRGWTNLLQKACIADLIVSSPINTENDINMEHILYARSLHKRLIVSVNPFWYEMTNKHCYIMNSSGESAFWVFAESIKRSNREGSTTYDARTQSTSEPWMHWESQMNDRKQGAIVFWVCLWKGNYTWSNSMSVFSIICQQGKSRKNLGARATIA